MSEPDTRRFSNPFLWLGAAAILLLSYLLVYPMVFGPLYDLFNNTAGEPIIEGIAKPVRWLYQRVPIYQTYVDFINTYFS